MDHTLGGRRYACRCFFFQAEDGIRDDLVTGVQTCALPILTSSLNRCFMLLIKRAENQDPETLVKTFVEVGPLMTLLSNRDHQVLYGRRGTGRSEERRVGKEWRSRGTGWTRTKERLRWGVAG